LSPHTRASRYEKHICKSSSSSGGGGRKKNWSRTPSNDRVKLNPEGENRWRRLPGNRQVRGLEVSAIADEEIAERKAKGKKGISSQWGKYSAKKIIYVVPRVKENDQGRVCPLREVAPRSGDMPRNVTEKRGKKTMNRQEKK